MTTTDVRSMAVGELSELARLGDSGEHLTLDAIAELVRRANKLAAIEAAYREGGWCGHLKDAIEGETR